LPPTDAEEHERDFRSVDGEVRVGKTRGRVVFESYDPDSLERFGAALPDAPRAARAGAEGFDVKHTIASAQRIGDIHGGGDFVHAWTIDDDKTLEDVRAAGVDGGITNDPALWLQAYGRAPHVDVADYLAARMRLEGDLR
jgi:glycerophosphoryl diester phosphodiesterase